MSNFGSGICAHLIRRCHVKADPDDNKFVDCAIVSNAEYIVTNDAHFDCLADIPFPHVSVRHIDEFLEELLEMDAGES